MDASITAIVLAAGKGTRMNAPSDKNKVVYNLADKPIISYTYDMLKQAGIENIVVVVGYASDSVRQALGDKVRYAIQENPNGTGHALQCALPSLPDNCQTVICMSGDDSAFYPSSLMQQLYEKHRQAQADITLVTIQKKDPNGLGRIIRGADGKIAEIVEEKDASPDQKRITEINTALYCFDRSFLVSALNQLDPNPITGEYYLTDVIKYATNNNKTLTALVWPSDDIWFGVNTPEQLSEAEARMLAKVR